MYLAIVDHQPVPGVTVGDIGPKAYGGFATTDNGCKFVLLCGARFSNVTCFSK